MEYILNIRERDELASAEISNKENNMALDQKVITPEDTKKLQDVESAGLRILQEIDDLNGGLKDTVKALAEELGVKPGSIMKSIKLVHKNKIADDKEATDDVQEILHILGHV